MHPKKFSEYTPTTSATGSEIAPIVKGGANTVIRLRDLPVSTATQAAIDASAADISGATATALAGKQPLDSDLTALAALAPADDAVIQRKGGVWVTRTPIQLKTDLSLSTADVAEGSNLYYTNARADARITAQKAAANGLATLDSNGVLPIAQLPPLSINDTFVVASQAAMLALNAQRGDTAKRTDTGEVFILGADPATTLSNWVLLSSSFTAKVDSVAGRTGAIVLTQADIANLTPDLALKVVIAGDLAGTPAAALVKARTADLTIGVTGQAADVICNGTGDMPKTDTALAALGTAGGGMAWMRPGNYSGEVDMVVPSNVILSGSGYATKITFANNKMIAINNRANVTVRDLRLDMSLGNTQNSFSILIGQPNNVTIENCYIIDAYAFGIFINTASSTETGKFKILHNYITGKANNDLIGGGPQNSSQVMSEYVIDGNIVIHDGSKPESGTYRNSIDIVAQRRSVITNNVLRGGLLLGGEQIPHQDVIITGNQVANPIGIPYTQIGVLCQSNNGTLPSGSIIVANNVVRNGQIYMQGQSDISARTQKVIITGNQITGMTGQAYADANYAINLRYMANVTVADNIVDNAGIGIYTNDVQEITVKDNKFLNCTTPSSFVNTTKISGRNNLGINPDVFYNPGNIGGTVTFDRANGNHQVFTLTSNVTAATFTPGQFPGDEMVITTIQGAGGGYYITFPGNVKLQFGGRYVFSPSATMTDHLRLRWGGTNWHEISRDMGNDQYTSQSQTGHYFGRTNPLGDATVSIARTTGEGDPTIAGGTVAVFQNNQTSAYSGGIAILVGSAASATLYFGDKDDIGAGKIAWSNVTNTYTVSGGNISVNNNKITSLATPTASGDAVNKSYADALAVGLGRVYNVKDAVYGAVADGVTSDSTAINAASAAANAAGGGIVWFPNSATAYAVNAALNLYPNVYFLGASFGGVTLLKIGATTGGNADIFRSTVGTASTYLDNVRIENLILDGTNQNTGGNLATLQGINGLTVRNVKLINPNQFGLAIGSVGGATPYIERLLVENIYYTATGGTGTQDALGGGGIKNGLYRNIKIVKNNRAGTGIDLTNMDQVDFKDIFVEFLNPVATNWGLSSDFGATNVKIDGVHIKNAGQYGIYMGTNGTASPADIKISNVTVDTVMNLGIWVQGASAARAKDLKIINATVRGYATPNASQGIKVEYTDGFTINGNTVAAPGLSGQYPILVSNVTNGSVKHNNFDSNITLGVLKSGTNSGVDISQNNYASVPATQTDALSVRDDVVTLPINPLAVSEGGTGARSAAAARTSLGAEPSITAGTTSQYYRGDKSMQTLDTAAVPENGNLYYTAARVNSAFDTRLATKTTGDLTEGANLYYTNARADARITAQKGVANGLATLDGSGLIPSSQLPALAITSTQVVGSQAAQLALTAQEGDVAVRTDQNKSYIKNSGTAGTMADWQELLTPTDLVLSVNGQTGAVVLTTSNIAEGTNLYYTEARVSANATVVSKAAKGANSDITSLSGLTTALSVPQGGTGVATLTGLVKGNGASAYSAAVAGTDYVSPTGAETITNKVITSPKINQVLDTNGATVFSYTTVASAVNYLDARNNGAGFSPELRALGSDTNISVNIIPKGTGRLSVGGVVVPTISSTDTLTSKTIDGGSNTITNVSLTTGVTGVLPVANGGSGSNTLIYVTLTGAQTVAGVKTFTNDLRTDGRYYIKGTDGTYTSLFGSANTAPNQDFHVMPDYVRQSGGNTTLYYGFNAQINKIQYNSSGSGSNIMLLQMNQDASVYTNKNQLDDGAGKMQVLNLIVASPTPAALATNGTNGAPGLTVTGQKGGATTGTTGQNGGAGGSIILTAGAGGDAPSGSANGTGGSITLIPGLGGSGAGTAAGAGQIVLKAANNRDDLVLFQNSSGTTYIRADSSFGRLAVGQSGAPTARLDVAASATGAASIRVRTGVAPTTPNDGDIWQDGTHFYGRINGATYVLDNTTTSVPVEVTGTTQAAAVNQRYIANNAARVGFTLPATAAVGDQVLIRGKGAGGWRLGQNASQVIHGATDSTTGTGGYVESQTRYDVLAVECITANTEWLIISNRGTLTVV